jgi:RNA polymerase sporulation-specific sigma factor
MLSVLALLLLQGPLFSLHLGGSSTFPRPLSGAEEQECIQRAVAGDEGARNKLIEHNLRLVAHIVKKYYSQTGDTDDLISIGTIGLIKAVNTYRQEKGIKLATYASRCIENEILMHLRKTRRLQGEVSLNDAMEQDEENGGLALIDVLKVEDTMLDDLNTRESCQRVRRGVEECLDQRERQVILERYGLFGQKPLPQREVAEELGISRSYVSSRQYCKRSHRSAA